MDHEEIQAAKTGDEAGRRRTVEASIVSWKKELVDLSARNNLLYFRNLKAGTIDFSESVGILPALLKGGSISLSSITEQDQALRALLRRARTIRKKAEVAFEEKGLEPMFLAYGLATWDESEEARKSPPAAPVCLIPAHLSEQAGGNDYLLSVAGEPRLNPTLLRKLESEFGVRLDGDASDSRLIEAEEIGDLDRECEWLFEQAHSVKGFAVNASLVLGTFSYAKLPMVLDLERGAEELIGHDLVAALAGDESAQGQLREKLGEGGDPLISAPDLIPPSKENLVLDADSSQSFAINSVLAGRNAIIQGPPGTGKSQTIANLIAALVAEGKTVLFVAEKRAAIDAVFKRLDDVGLDHLLLDLHDGQKKRGAFAQEIAETIERHRNQSEPSSADRDRRLVRAREELNRRNNAQHRVRSPWGLSAYQARIRLAGIPEAAKSDIRIEAAVLQSIDETKANRVREAIRDWFQLGAPDLYAQSPVWAEVTFGDEPDPRAAVEAASAAKDRLDKLEGKLVDLSDQMGVERPRNAASAQSLIDLSDDVAELSESLELGVFEEDVSNLLEVLQPMSNGALSKSLATISSSDYRDARRIISGLCTPGLASVDTAKQYQALEQAKVLEEAWSRIGSSLSVPILASGRVGAREALDGFLRSLQSLRFWLPGIGDDQTSLEALHSSLEEARSDSATAVRMVEIRSKERELVEAGLPGLLSSPGWEDLTLEEAIDRFDHIWLSSILKHLVFEDPDAQKTGTSSLVADFKDLDQTHIETGAEKVRRACALRLKDVRDKHGEQDMLVARQSAFSPRSRKHLPVRRYFEKAPDVIRAAKPCWAMSPLVVSQMLPAKASLFDVVIFDEASQITPPDAVPAILRGQQLVVAGDTQQLPPTRFFLGTNEEEEEAEEEEDGRVDDGTHNFESILDALTGLIPAKMLTWHYRSEDERLIAFSNAHIYNSRLATFPGARSDDPIRHELAPWEPSVSDRANSPDAEVDLVARLVLDHALNNPDESLGVIAMGIRHSNRIAERLEQIRQEMSEADDAEEDERGKFERFVFSGDSSEPFFVKNLERVQGDERDVILLSIGYGKDPVTGRMRYAFGPISNEGGERRLNVAVSRAKKRLTLISSFDYQDLDDAKLTKTGPRLLKRYLEYAESGGRSLGSEAELPPELNAFEIQVRDALEAEALSLSPQHGVSGYRIDFAVKDPDSPGRYVLAVECDGATYHSSPTARERDRLRQSHLERLGWRFHRIWSSDWFLDQRAEVEKVVEAYEAALAEKEGSGNPPAPFDRCREKVRLSNPQRQRPNRPAVFRSYDPSQIAILIRWIESDTLPRTRTELAEETIEELGFSRKGTRIVAAVEAALNIVRGPGQTTFPEISRRRKGASASAGAGVSGASRDLDGEASRLLSKLPNDASPVDVTFETSSDDLRNLEAVRISYQRKGASRPGKPRVINPQEFRGVLMWAYCHKLGDVRCFRIDRISSFEPVPIHEWLPPDWSRRVAKLKADS
jgi:very-short-patch-repair endonuclease